MTFVETNKSNEVKTVHLNGHEVECLFVRSKAAKKLRIKVRLSGLEMIVPSSRTSVEALSFLMQHTSWVNEQLNRLKKFKALRKKDALSSGKILFRGELIPLTLIADPLWNGQNQVGLKDDGIYIKHATKIRTPMPVSLVNWLRKAARESIIKQVELLEKKIKPRAHRIYIMSQKTKWGNCSAKGNLSFNWRLIMAPDYVLRYLVTHEVTHLALPDHSRQFWLTVQSLCPETERAKRWLSTNGPRLLADMAQLFPKQSHIVSKSN